MENMTSIPFRGCALPLEAQYLYRQGLFLSQEGKKEQAIRSFRMAVILAPQFSQAYNAMGNCLDELGESEEAIRKYEKVLALEPGHAEARFKLELVRSRLKQNPGGGTAAVPLAGRGVGGRAAAPKGTEELSLFRCLVLSPESWT